MAVEPPFGNLTDPKNARPVQGIPTWIVEQVNNEIRRYYADHAGSLTLSEADERYSVMDELLPPSELPSIYQLPKPYCVYILKCEWKGFDELSSLEYVKRVLQERAESFGYDYTEDWMEAVYYSGPPRYVGCSTNPYARIHEHTRIREHLNDIKGFDPSGAKFTAMFPPYAVQRIEWVDDEQAAKQLEQETANRLNREEGYFVHPRPTD